MPTRLRSLPLASFAAILLMLAGAVSPAEAQFGKKLKNALKQNAEDKAVQAAVGEENKAIDSATTGGPDSAAGVVAPAPAAAAAPAPPAATAATSSSPAAPGGKPDALKSGEGAWANYDFKPGDRALYVDDFTADEVGDFPKRMEFKAGALEIVDWQGTRYLRATENSKFYVNLPEILPERFTMEFDYSIPSGGEVWISFGDENKRVQFGDGTAGTYNAAAKIVANGRLPDGERGALRRGRVLADGKYIKAYLDDTRVINVPNADVGRSIRFSSSPTPTPRSPRCSATSASRPVGRNCTTPSPRRAGLPPRGSTSTRGATGSVPSPRRRSRRSARC